MKRNKLFFILLFMIGILCIPLHSRAYSGLYISKNEDYLLTTKKPTNRTEGHYLEFVMEETYTVKSGDTLWDIAETYWGNGACYKQILSDNSDVVTTPELLMPDTELQLKVKLYTEAGMEDWMQTATNELIADAGAFDMYHFSSPYTIFTSVPYANDLQEVDPYVHWEEFQEEVRDCSKRICGERVSDLSFERYQVTEMGSLCGYSFTFDAGDKEYVIMPYFCYSDTRKSEVFALCEKAYCSQELLEEIRGKARYAAVAFLDPGVYYEKEQDYIGMEEWNYPQLRNPFTDAMYRLYTGPLEQIEDYPEDEVIQWKNPEFEKLVREVLADMWQLTPEKKQAFMERDMTVADLGNIEELGIDYIAETGEKEEALYVRLNSNHNMLCGFGAHITAEEAERSKLFTTLEDLKNFRELKSLDIWLDGWDVMDMSAIGELVYLRELDCYICSDVHVENLDFLGNLVKLRKLKLYGDADFYENVTDLSVLLNCPNLAYLFLKTYNVENYDFLGELPIYTISLDSGEENDDLLPDESLLPDAHFIWFNGQQIQYNVGESDVGAENAVERLTVLLAFIGVIDTDMQTDDGKCTEWTIEKMKEIEGAKCYAFDLRYTEDEEINGEMAGRLIGSYAVSRGGSTFYHYNQADDKWEQMK